MDKKIRGGFRPGSGRKPKNVKAVTISLPVELIEALPKEKSAFIVKAIQHYLKKE